MDLLTWCCNYLDYRNAFTHDLTEKKIEGSRIDCVSKTKGRVCYLVREELFETVFSEVKEGAITLVCLNTKSNLDFLVKNWDSFVANPKLILFFVNPEANLHWPLIPYRHDMIVDRQSLKAGLKSISDSVPPVI